MESVGKRSQTRSIKRKKEKKVKNLAWLQMFYVIILALIIFAVGRFI
ncbi:MAG: hypothetical protein ACRC57_00440 [Sarcina sp.]